MQTNVTVWETLEFDNPDVYGDVYQDLSLFKYSFYRDEIQELLRKKQIVRSVNGHLVVLEIRGRQVTYFFEMSDGTRTQPTHFVKLPFFRISREKWSELVLLLAEAETNARFNFPQRAEDFVPLEMPNIFFSKD